MTVNLSGKSFEDNLELIEILKISFKYAPDRFLPDIQSGTYDFVRTVDFTDSFIGFQDSYKSQ